MKIIAGTSKITTMVGTSPLIFEIEGELNDSVTIAEYLRQWKRTNPVPDPQEFVNYVNDIGQFSIKLHKTNSNVHRD